MKISTIAIATVMLIALASCIREEPKNAECDIVAVTLPGDVLNRQPLIENDKVTLIVKNDVSLLALAPEFELTPGATIEPASGTVRNFTEPQLYTVTSEDGEWHKTYTVTVERNNTINLNYNFENVRTDSVMGGFCVYDIFYEVGPDGKEIMTWASANAAYALSFQASSPTTFPTYQGEDGLNGTKCVVLVTRSTGSWGAKLKKPLASGNLFIGKFDMSDAVNHPLQATHFGTPFYNIPTVLSGSYKYMPGEVYCEPGADGELQPVPGVTDTFNIYAVLFEATDDMEWLDGTNVLAADNPNIICTAEIDDRRATDEWVQFSVPFKYREGKTIDLQKLKDGKYSITVAMASSTEGDFFMGAIGSTLKVDGLSITCYTEE